MTPLGWPGIARLGLVQAALGAIVMLVTSLLNRVMVVEYALPAMIPAGLVAWHYAVQLSRPRWGHGSDSGGRRTPWIVGGMAVLAAGAMLATQATIAGDAAWAFAAKLAAFTMIGGGVGAAGTSLLALLATRTTPARRPAAAATTWIMMVAGIAITAKLAGGALDPFSPGRLLTVAAVVAAGALLLSTVAVWGIEGSARVRSEARVPFAQTMGEVWAEPRARRFTIFVALSMLAYAMQDLILEPFAGLVFGLTPGQSTALSGTQHMGVMLGMILVGAGGRSIARRLGFDMGGWIVGGCLASAAALGLLALAASHGPGWPLAPTVFALGLGNGIFAVAAVGAMMDYAGGGGREGTRIGLWGAAQAVAFGVGGFSGAALVDLGRALLPTATAFTGVFAFEAALFIAAALLALRLSDARAPYPTIASGATA